MEEQWQMQVVSFEPSMADDVARCYNELIAPVPECSPVEAERFASLEALRHDRLREEQIAVPREGGEVAGFVHVGLALPATGDEYPTGEPAAIRALSYRPGERRVGQALLGWAEEWARERERADVVAWHAGLRYRFYHFGWAHLSERIGHVRALFGMNGYREVDSELLLTWPDFEPSPAERPEVEFELKLDWHDGPIGPRLSVLAMRDEKEVGHCRIDHGQHSQGPRAQEWCYCNALWVADALQGRRLGRYLLSTGLAEMRKAGCRHAAISTNGTNYRAQLMYTNMGYRMTDYTVAFRKELPAT
jgi:GNAT superfamily N-acetyltransferase